MRRFPLLLFCSLGLLVGSHPAGAIQLTWVSGDTVLSFASARRCTLVVDATAEGGLPGEWRLLWVADSCEIIPHPQACTANLATVSALQSESHWSRVSEHRIDAVFCSPGTARASVAHFVKTCSA